MEKKATLVILSPRFPYPLEKGDKLRLYHQLVGLSKSFHVHLISLTEEDIAPEHLSKVDEFCSSINLIKQKALRSVRAALRSLLFTEPLQQSYYYSSKSEAKIQKLIDEIKPDVIFVQLIRMAKFVEESKTPRLLDYMDAMSLNMSREASKHNWPFSMIYKREAKLLTKLETSLSSKFDKKVIISEQDKLYLKSNGVDDLIVQSNGVDLDFFDATKVGPISDQKDLVFVGNMGYLPNVEAAEYIVSDIISEYIANLSVLIAGARPHERVLKLKSDTVTVTGWVEDIREAYLSGKIVIAPIFTGAGQQNKILEAMALGQACITTSQVNAAIGGTVNKNILIADNAEQFSSQINYLLNSKDLRQEIGRNARIFVEQKYEWQTQVRILEQALLDLSK